MGSYRALKYQFVEILAAAVPTAYPAAGSQQMLFANDVGHMIIFNTLNQPIAISLDGVTDWMRFPVMTTNNFPIDIGFEDFGVLVPASIGVVGGGLYVRYTGSAPTTGALWVTAQR